MSATSWVAAAGLPVIGWLAGWLLSIGMHSARLDAPTVRADAPRAPEPTIGGAPEARVSVIVPARDEARRLPRLLDGLAASVPPPHEVIVVDDGSADDTVDIARAAGARVRSVEPPPGWTGKAWACWSGADAATGDVLVFLDADTEPGPDAVARLASAARETGGLVSAQPRHRIERPYERLSAGCNLVAVLGAGVGAPSRHRWWRGPVAFGPAIAISRETYFAIGGHEAVRAEVAEDLALARAAADAGRPVTASLGGETLGFRMYPEGAARLAEGWTKNLVAGAGGIPQLRLLLAVAWVTGGLQAALALVAAAGFDVSGRSVPTLLVPLALYVAYAVQTGVLLRRIGRFGAVTAAAFPVALAAFVTLFTRAALRDARGVAVQWRGRTVPAREAA